jgi:hypothetical protein
MEPAETRRRGFASRRLLSSRQTVRPRHQEKSIHEKNAPRPGKFYRDRFGVRFCGPFRCGRL